MSLEKDQQAVAELDRTRKEVLAQANKDSEQQLQLNPQLTPQEALLQLIAQVASSVRQQQLKTEQTIQQTLQQASAALSDAQNIDALFAQGTSTAAGCHSSGKQQYTALSAGTAAAPGKSTAAAPAVS